MCALYSGHPLAKPFWKAKSLEEMSPDEWESLCDGCGRCCLNKIEDADTGQIHLTKVACKLLDLSLCRCSDYPNRQNEVPDCLRLTPEMVRNLTWLPETCAYDRIAKGRDIPSWHPLKTGDPNTVHAAGISVRGFARSERRIKPENFEKYIIPDFPKKPAKSKS
jgi:uncharacterized protein